MIVHDEICTPHTKYDLDIIEKQNKEIKSLRLILKSHGEIISLICSTSFALRSFVLVFTAPLNC
jgi:hypothetical protein